MVFNDTTTNQGLLQEIDFYLFGSSATMNTTAYPVADRTRRINQRLNRIVSIIFKNDRRWKFDDFNHDEMNIFYTTLVEGQNDYEISGADFLTIEEVAVLNSDGKYRILTPIVREAGNAQKLQDLEDGDDGTPTHYEKHGNSIMMYPKPSLTYLTASLGLMVRGKRLPSYFTADDTTKEPGFNPLYHSYLSIGASYDYALANGMNNKVNQFAPELTRYEADIADDYARRSRDSQPKMTTDGGGEYVDNLFQ